MLGQALSDRQVTPEVATAMMLEVVDWWLGRLSEKERQKFFADMTARFDWHATNVEIPRLGETVSARAGREIDADAASLWRAVRHELSRPR